MHATSTYDVFEVVTAGRMYRLQGAALQEWIMQRRQEWKGPKILLFSQRPMLDGQNLANLIK